MTRLFIVRHGNTFERDEPPRRIGSRTDLPLTAAGIAQAKALGRHFAEQGITFARILTSPLARTRTTVKAIQTEMAEFVAPPPSVPPHKGEGGDVAHSVGHTSPGEAALSPPSPLWGGTEGGGAPRAGVPVDRSTEIAPFLAEIDHGPDEDQPETAVLARIGAKALAAWDEHAVPPPGWIVDADSRLAAWQALAATERATARDLLLVTSNGAARFALLAYNPLPSQGAENGADTPPPVPVGHLKLRTGAYGVIALAPDAPPTLTAWDIRP